MFKTKRLFCLRCQESHIFNIVGDGFGGFNWKCPNCGMERSATFNTGEENLEDEAYVAACIDGDAAEQWMHERGGYEYQESEDG